MSSDTDTVEDVETHDDGADAAQGRGSRLPRFANPKVGLAWTAAIFMLVLRVDLRWPVVLLQPQRRRQQRQRTRSRARRGQAGRHQLHLAGLQPRRAGPRQLAGVQHRRPRPGVHPGQDVAAVRTDPQAGHDRAHRQGPGRHRHRPPAHQRHRAGLRAGHRQVRHHSAEPDLPAHRVWPCAHRERLEDQQDRRAEQPVHRQLQRQSTAARCPAARPVQSADQPPTSTTKPPAGK